MPYIYKMSTLEAGYIPHKSIVDIFYTEILCTFSFFFFCFVFAFLCDYKGHLQII